MCMFVCSKCTYVSMCVSIYVCVCVCTKAPQSMQYYAGMQTTAERTRTRLRGRAFDICHLLSTRSVFSLFNQLSLGLFVSLSVCLPVCWSPCLLFPLSVCQFVLRLEAPSQQQVFSHCAYAMLCDCNKNTKASKVKQQNTTKLLIVTKLRKKTKSLPLRSRILNSAMCVYTHIQTSKHICMCCYSLQWLLLPNKQTLLAFLR